MRLGLIVAARKSFSKAKSLQKKGMESEALAGNLEALQEHENYALTINHDGLSEYPAGKSPDMNSPPDGGDRGGGGYGGGSDSYYGVDNYYGGDSYAGSGAGGWYDADGGYGDDDDYGSNDKSSGKASPPIIGMFSDSKESGSPVKFSVDLSLPLGMGLDQEAVVDNVKEGGQLAVAGLKPGSVVTAVGGVTVTSLADFKGAIADAKAVGAFKVTITFAHGVAPPAGIAMVSKADEDEALQVTIKAVQLVMQKKLPEALKLFKQAAGLNPSNVSLLLCYL